MLHAAGGAARERVGRTCSHTGTAAWRCRGGSAARGQPPGEAGTWAWSCEHGCACVHAPPADPLASLLATRRTPRRPHRVLDPGGPASSAPHARIANVSAPAAAPAALVQRGCPSIRRRHAALLQLRGPRCRSSSHSTPPCHARHACSHVSSGAPRGAAGQRGRDSRGGNLPCPLRMLCGTSPHTSPHTPPRTLAIDWRRY